MQLAIEAVKTQNKVINTFSQVLDTQGIEGKHAKDVDNNRYNSKAK